MHPDAERAARVWVRFAGLFGAEAVTRKYDKVPPPEWVQELARLKDYELDRGLRRLVSSGRAYVPTLPEFLKLCREVRSDDFPEPVSQLKALPRPPGMDGWDEMANRHLFGYFLGRAHHKLRIPKGREEVGPFLAAKRTWALMMREAEGLKELPADHGRKWWDEFMAKAELVVDDIRKEQAA